MVDFKGLSSEVMFYKKALDKIGIEVQVIRHGKFKGAVEPFILDKLSDENRSQIKDYAGSLWNQIIADISKSRNISAEQLNRIADNLSGNLASGAFENKLVDGLCTGMNCIDTLKSLSGIKMDKDLNLVSMNKYSKVPETKIDYSPNKIAVVYASGTIVTGKGNDDKHRRELLCRCDKKSKDRYHCQGNRYQSQFSRRKCSCFRYHMAGTNLAARVKPVVVSMGNYAASGGYFISAPGTKIYADPMTISGSIGVFGLIPNAGKFWKINSGLQTETVNTNKNSDFPSILRPMNLMKKR